MKKAIEISQFLANIFAVIAVIYASHTFLVGIEEKKQIENREIIQRTLKISQNLNKQLGNNHISFFGIKSEEEIIKELHSSIPLLIETAVLIENGMVDEKLLFESIAMLNLQNLPLNLRKYLPVENRDQDREKYEIYKWYVLNLDKLKTLKLWAQRQRSELY